MMLTSQSIEQQVLEEESKMPLQQQENLRDVFIQNYGVTMEIPAYYYYDGKYVPTKKDFVVTMAFHIIPNKKIDNVQTTFLDGRFEENNFDEICGQYGSNLILNLFKISGRQGLLKQKEIVLKNVQSAILEFSKSGKLMAIFIIEEKILNIYESENIFECFDNIKQHKPIMSIKNSDICHAHKIAFDVEDKVVLISSKTQVITYSLERKGKLIQRYTIDQVKYTAILDVMVSTQLHVENSIDAIQQQEYGYKCQIACKVNGSTTIHFFDINEPNDTRSIIYMRNIGKIIVKISDDFQMAVFSNGVENYLLKGRSQEYYPRIQKDKFIRYILSEKGSFYFVTTKDYDRDIDVFNSEEKDFNASIKRKSEPGILRIFDAIIEQDINSERGLMKILMQVGETLHLDTIDIDKCYNEELNDEVIESVQDNYYHAQGFNWPYFSYGTKDNYVIILNAFNPSFIQRYELPLNVTVICHTFLTDTSDLYVLCETNDNHFEAFYIDLDKANPQCEGPVMRYSFNLVDKAQALSFHVRASSRKEKIDLNKVLMFFMMHGTKLYGYTKKDLRQLSCNAQNLSYFSDDYFFYMSSQIIQVKGKSILHTCVYSIECLFGSYKITRVYEDNNSKAEILNFGVDNTRKRLMILTGIKNNHDKRDKFLTIYDLEAEKVLFQIMIKNREIIGRLKTNLYNFTEGHIYFNNKVIKIRYDLIEQRQGASIQESEVFDHYNDIFKLPLPGDDIQSGTPLQTCLYNRLAYIIKNPNNPLKVLILPYLHERRIYLNRRHSSNQFYTIYEQAGVKYILCLCINDNKLYIYTETGILCDKVVYDDLADKYGKPESISENGQKFMFRKSSQSYEFHLLTLSLSGFKYDQSIHIKEKIQKYLENSKEENRNTVGSSQKKCKEINEYWVNIVEQLDHLRHIQFQYNLNDDGDFLVQIGPNKKFKKEMKNKIFEEDCKENIQNCSLFYFFPSQISSTEEFMYFDSEDDDVYDLKGCSMNEKYIFFWNLGVVWQLDLKTKELKRLSIYISEAETSTFIKCVRCGSNEDIVAIRVSQSPCKDCIIYWDLLLQKEIDYFDVDSSALTFQDAQGNQFIIERDRIYSVKSGCKIKSYRAQVSDFDIQNCKFGFQYGYRVEAETQNWAIFRNYINLSFSYMTFVIKQKIEKKCSYKSHFDIEGYDFVLNNNTIFTENNGSILNQDFLKMQYILKNYFQLNPDLLESLHYRTLLGQLPLHFALTQNNNRMVNLLLNYMAKIEYVSPSIYNVYKDLINFQKFEEYLSQCPFKTKQMKNKQTIKLVRQRWQTEAQEILVCTPSQCSFVDDVYFQSQMGEEPNNPESLTFAVNIQSVRADWIVNTEEGLRFLKELLRQQNKDVFMTPYVKIIVEFLYQKYSANIMTRLMPPFLMHLIAVFVLIALSEKERDSLFEHIEHHELEEVVEDKYSLIKYQKNVVQIISGILNIVNLTVFGIQTYHLGRMQLKRFWAYLDFFQLSVNLVISSSLLIDINIITLRVFEAILSVIMMLKILYFLRLIGEIAPLIDIIFTIIYEIRYFMTIYIIGLVSFVFAFYSIGRNAAQIAGDEHAPGYSTYLGAFDHVYLSSLGEFDTDSYFESPMMPALLFLFLAMSFLMQIHLLNMLIAIMGDLFYTSKVNKEANKKMSQLAFVVENWWIDPIQDKDQIMYLIAAFKIEEENDSDEQRFNTINKYLINLNVKQSNLMKELKTLKVSVETQGKMSHY